MSVMFYNLRFPVLLELNQIAVLNPPVNVVQSVKSMLLLKFSLVPLIAELR